jgi:hypothetical protein
VQSCLQGLIDLMPQYFEGREGGRILGVRCNFRYEVYSFYSGEPMMKLDATNLALAPPPVQEPTGSTGEFALKLFCFSCYLIRSMFTIIALTININTSISRSPR